MEQKSFDQLLRERLEKLEVPFQPDHWEVLSDRLDAEEAGTPDPEMGRLDDVVFERLNSYTPANSPRDWDKLVDRLDANQRLLDRVRAYKLLEATLVAALLLLFLRWPAPQHSLASLPIPVPAEHPQLERAAPAVVPTAEIFEVSTVASLAGDELYRTGDATLPSPVTEVLPGTQATTPAVLPEAPLSQLSLVLPAFRLPVQPDLQRENQAAGFVDQLPVQPGLLALNERALPGQIQPVPATQTHALSISMYGGVDYNRIITPSQEPSIEKNGDVTDGYDGFDRFALGYGGGVSMGLGMGRWEVGAGLGYVAKQYAPIPLTFKTGAFSGYTIEMLQNVELNIINLPIHTRYNFMDRGRWRLYGQLGASMQVAFEANYYVSYPRLEGLPSRVRQTPTQTSVVGDRSDGLFQGGNFWENAYMTANLGLGLERNVADRWSMFFQPTYQHTLGYFTDGIGPTSDRIHTMSVITGIRVRLQQN